MRTFLKLLVGLLVVGALLVVLDRVALSRSEAAVAERVQRNAGLAEPPEVEIRGIPFLTQAVAGRYDDVVVRASTIQAGNLPVESFVAELSGVRIPLHDVVQDRPRPVPVDTFNARAVLTYEAISGAVADRGLTVAPAGDGLVRVSGTARILRRDVDVAAVSRAELVDGAVRLTPERFETGLDVADSLLTRALGDRFDLTVPIGGLPYGLQVTSLVVGADGVVLRARSDGAVLPP